MPHKIAILALFLVVVAACSDDDSATTVAAVTTSTTSPATTTTGATPATTTTTSAPVTTTVAPTVTSSTSTTIAAVTTTTSTTSTTTTTTAPAVTTTTVPRSPNAPDGDITFPPTLTSHAADYDAGLGDFVAFVNLTATGDDADGDDVTYEWYSSDQGFLGTGADLTVPLSTMGSDAAQPFITVVMTDGNGNRTEKQIQLIVWIPSE